MLWSLIKILVFVGLVAVATYGAGLLIETTGEVRIAFADVEYVLSPLLVVVALALLLLGMWVLLKLAGLLVATLRFINGDETAISRYFDRNRERKGYEALSDGMMALASGEGRTAMAKAQKAEKYLDRPDLTTLLSAQAAEAAGDTKHATEAYKRLLQNDRTRFVGVHGLLKQKLSEGDTATAMKLAEKAFALRPRHVETQDTLLRLQAQDEDWSGARVTLGAKLKSGDLPRDVHKRREAVLQLAHARDELAAGHTEAARTEALEANRLSPDLVPAAVLAARMHIDGDQGRYAAKVLKVAWKAQPHPDLAAAFADIAPDETPEQRIKRFRALIKLAPDHPEARMLDAELHLANEDFPAARKALGDLAESAPTVRSLSLMAAIERGEGADDIIVRGWLTKALTVSRGPQWVCGQCGTVHGNWAPVCQGCAAFDTLSWAEPRKTEDTAAEAMQAQMLPLIVGQIEAPVEAAIEDDAIVDPIDADEIEDAEVSTEK